MPSGAKVLVELHNRRYLIPEEALQDCNIPVTAILEEILREVGAPPDLDGSELEEKLSTWKNPVVAYFPGE